MSHKLVFVTLNCEYGVIDMCGDCGGKHSVEDIFECVSNPSHLSMKFMSLSRGCQNYRYAIFLTILPQIGGEKNYP